MNELKIGDLVTIEHHESLGVMQVSNIGVSGVQCESLPDNPSYHVEVFPDVWVIAQPVPVPVTDKEPESIEPVPVTGQVQVGVPEAVGSIDTATGLWVPPVAGSDAGVL